MKFAIIAAGNGSRLQQEGVAKPKPLVELDGRPMIRRLIDIFVNCDDGKACEEICIIVNEEMTEVREYLENIQLPVPLRLVVKSTPSSMHSLAALAPYLRGSRFVLTTVDTIFHEDMLDKYVKHINEHPEADAVMGVTEYIDDEKPLYIKEDTEHRIISYDDQPNGGGIVSAGVYGLGDTALDVLDECLATGVSRMRNFQRALLTHGLTVLGFSLGKVIDVDHASDIPLAQQFLLTPLTSKLQPLTSNL